MIERPLFIPLCRKWFEQFECGEKTTEYRVWGPRWNIGTCMPGRAVTLSLGYGKARRLHGVIKAFDIVGPDADPAIAEVYPGKNQFAAIEILLDCVGERRAGAICELAGMDSGLIGGENG